MVRLEHSLLAVEMEHTVHAMLDLVAPAAPPADRARVEVALVLDRSGSMAGPKLETAKESATYLIRRMGGGDRLALIKEGSDKVHRLWIGAKLVRIHHAAR